MDRVDYKQFIQIPGSRAVYEILRSGVNAFIRCGYITFSKNSDEQSMEAVEGDEMLTLDALLVNDQLMDTDQLAPSSELYSIACSCKVC